MGEDKKRLHSGEFAAGRKLLFVGIDPGCPTSESVLLVMERSADGVYTVIESKRLGGDTSISVVVEAKGSA